MKRRRQQKLERRMQEFRSSDGRPDSGARARGRLLPSRVRLRGAGPPRPPRVALPSGGQRWVRLGPPPRGSSCFKFLGSGNFRVCTTQGRHAANPPWACYVASALDRPGLLSAATSAPLRRFLRISSSVSVHFPEGEGSWEIERNHGTIVPYRSLEGNSPRASDCLVVVGFFLTASDDPSLAWDPDSTCRWRLVGLVFLPIPFPLVCPPASRPHWRAVETRVICLGDFADCIQVYSASLVRGGGGVGFWGEREQGGNTSRTSIHR